MRWLLSILAVLLVVPRYAGDERMPTIGDRPGVRAEPYRPDGGWPRRIGALVPVGGVTLNSYDAAFGGFSGIAIRDGRALLLNDGGNVLSLVLRQGRVVDARGHVLPDGPSIGWNRRDRDSESLVLDPATGTAWVGFENDNEIWRYSADLMRATGKAKPEEMREWRTNQGAESLVRLRDGRFIAIAERTPDRRTRHMLLFSGDPTDPRTRVRPMLLRVPERYHPSDAAELPNGDLLVLLRRFQYPFRFTAKLLRVRRAALEAGTDVAGTVIATLAPPLLGENAEGLAITRERGRTMLWVVSDNDGMPWRPTYLLKFRLVE